MKLEDALNAAPKAVAATYATVLFVRGNVEQEGAQYQTSKIVRLGN
jgi:tRNA U34 5-methylaminomethyl-2-thiouridine-forming methyltransferase MnmC